MLFNRVLMLKISKQFHYNYYVIQFRLCSSGSGKTDKLFVENGRMTDEKMKKHLSLPVVERLNANLKPYISKKYNEIYSVYERMSGIDEVKEAQNRVFKIQDMVKEAQDRKRDLVYQLGMIRNELQQLHTDVMNCQRGEPRYLGLIKREIEVMQKEKEKMKIYELADTEERELFAHFTSSLQMSQEKGRSQADKVKYWGFIVSILVGFLSVIGTIITYNYRSSQTNELRQQTKELQDSIEFLKGTVERLDLSVQKLRLELRKRNEIKKQESWIAYANRKIGGVIRYFNPYNS